MQRLRYIGPRVDGLTIPAAGIDLWMPNEVKEVPDDVAKSLLERTDFEAERPHKKPQPASGEVD